MEEAYRFRVVAWWTSGRTGIAKSSSAPSAIHFTSPPQFGGLEGMWTPEDLLLGAVAGCYTTTFRTLAEYLKFEYIDLQVETEAIVSKAEKGYSIAEIAIQPRLTIPSEKLRDRALQLLDKTGTVCLISRALAVTLRLEPRVEVGSVLQMG